MRYTFGHTDMAAERLKNIADFFNPFSRQWTKMIDQGGSIVVDELEDVETTIPVFKKYLRINEGLINSQGAVLYVGRILDNCISGFKVQENKSDSIVVANRVAAGWFYRNTQSIWETERFIKNTIRENERKKIAEELLGFIHSGNNHSNITWKMKRIIITS